LRNKNIPYLLLQHRQLALPFAMSRLFGEQSLEDASSQQEILHRSARITAGNVRFTPNELGDRPRVLRFAFPIGHLRKRGTARQDINQYQCSNGARSSAPTDAVIFIGHNSLHVPLNPDYCDLYTYVEILLVKVSSLSAWLLLALHFQHWLPISCALRRQANSYRGGMIKVPQHTIGFEGRPLGKS
jgi:hypothetical protein